MERSLPYWKDLVNAAFQRGNITDMPNQPSWGMANKWIAEALDSAGRKQVDLARHLGVSESVVSKMIHSPRELRAAEAEKIRNFLGERVPSGAVSYAELHGASTVRQPDTKLTVPFRTEMTEDIPVLGTALGGTSGGDFTMNGDSGMRVRRPPRLAGRGDVFALFVQGDSMGPRYPSGELIFLETRRPPQNGDHVVIELHANEEGVQEAYLKLLVAITPTKVRLQQYNPSRALEIDRRKVKQIVRVMTTLDLLGI